MEVSAGHASLPPASPSRDLVQESGDEQSSEFGEPEEEHTIFVFFGSTYKEESDFSYALTYEHLLAPGWGIGITLEGTPSVRKPVLFFPRIAYIPLERFFLVAAPGLEFEGEPHFAFRVGAGWEIPLNGPFGLALVLNYDVVEDSSDAIVAGIEFGYVW